MSESLRTRTMHEVPTCRDVFRHRRARGMSEVWGVEEGVDVTTDEQEMAVACERERRRFRAQEQAVDRMRRKLLLMRRKLKLAKEKNLALSVFREELERERWARDASRGDCPLAGDDAWVGCRTLTIEY